MTGKRGKGIAAVLLVTLLVALSPIATAAAGGLGGTEASADVGIAAVQTQSGDEVTIASDLEDDAERGEVVEVLVHMDAERATFGTTTRGDSPTALRAEAESTQATVRTAADSSPHIEVVSEFWVANVMLLEVDTSEVALEDLARIDGVVGLYDNFEVETASATAGDAGEDAVATDAAADAFGEAAYTYGLEQINVPETWKRFDATGEGVSVAVLDTGLDADHPEFEEFDAEENWAYVNETGGIDESKGPSDAVGHGTHVAGTVVGGNESGTHIGVAPDAELYAGAVIPNGSGTMAQVLGGIEWALENDVDIVSMSLGAPGHNDIYVEVHENAHEMGTLVVAAIGNDGEGTSGSPGNDHTSLAVGASNSDLGIADFSGGELVDTAAAYDYAAPPDWPAEYVVPDVAAPGVEVMSAEPGGGYGPRPGTSMATPHVSGTAALVLSANPDLGVDEIQTTLVEGAEKPPEHIATDAQAERDGKDTRYGHGIVDAHESVALVANDTASLTASVEYAGEPAADVPVRVAGESDDPLLDFTDANGTADYELAPGEYEVSAGEFGFATATETIAVANGSETVTLTLEPNVDAAVVSGQPDVVGSNRSIVVDTRVPTLETSPVQPTDGSVGADAIDNVTVYDATDPRDRERIATTKPGESVAVADELGVETFDGYLGVEIETGSLEDEDPALELEQLFGGTGTDVAVTTGPTETLADPKPVDVTLNATLDESIEIGERVEPSITVTNRGDVTGEFLVTAEFDDGAEPGSVRLDVITVEGGETVSETYPISGVGAAFGGGDLEQTIGLYDPATFRPIATANNTLSVEAAGDVTGTVTDADGEPIEGAEIRLVDTETFETVAQPTTDENGSYHVDVGQRAPTSWYVTVEHPQYGLEEIGTPMDGVPSTTDGSEQVVDVELAASAAYTFRIEADEPTPLGFPGDVDGTVGDVLLENGTGVVWAFDTETGEWTQADVDDELEPLEAVVVVSDEDATAEVVFEGPPGDVETPTPAAGEFDAGWNFVAPSQHAPVGETFDGTAAPSAFLDVFDGPGSPMVPGENLDRPGFSLPDDEVENATVNPFSGYFVYANEDGTVPAYVHDGVTHSDANDLLNIETETIRGTVTAAHGGEPIETATVSLEGTTLGTFTNAAGEFTVEEVPTGSEQTVVADAAGFEPAAVTADAGAENVTIELQETEYVAVEGADVPSSVAIGEDLAVDANVSNRGTETGTATVQLRVGENVTADAGAILQDNETFIVDTTEATIDAGGTVTVELGDEIRRFHPTGTQTVAIATGDEIEVVGTIDVEPAAETTPSSAARSSTLASAVGS